MTEQKKRWSKSTWVCAVLFASFLILSFCGLIVYYIAKTTAEYKEANPYYSWGKPAEYESGDQAFQSALDDETKRRKNSEQIFQGMQKNTETELDQMEMNRNLEKPKKSIDEFNRRQQSLDLQRTFDKKPF